jgi:hypothetical protein
LKTMKRWSVVVVAIAFCSRPFLHAAEPTIFGSVAALLQPTDRAAIARLARGRALLAVEALRTDAWLETWLALVYLQPESDVRGVRRGRIVELETLVRDEPVVGTVLVVKPWTHHSNGGCEGLEVGVQAPRAATVQQLPTMEYAYEEPGAVVLERRGKWFRVRLNSGSAWLEASAQDEFYGLERLFENGLTYLTEAWNGQVASSPGSAGRPGKFRRLATDQPVRVRRASREKEGLWFLVDILSHSACGGDGEPTVADRGWVPAYGKADSPTIWFYSRGC